MQDSVVANKTKKQDAAWAFAKAVADDECVKCNEFTDTIKAELGAIVTPLMRGLCISGLVGSFLFALFGY